MKVIGLHDFHQWNSHIIHVAKGNTGQGCFLSLKMKGRNTLPETNSKNTWRWMVGRRSFPFGMAYFQGRTVSFREGILMEISLKFLLAASVIQIVDRHYKSQICLRCLKNDVLPLGIILVIFSADDWSVQSPSKSIVFTRWWFQILFIFIPILGNDLGNL